MQVWIYHEGYLEDSISQMCLILETYDQRRSQVLGNGGITENMLQCHIHDHTCACVVHDFTDDCLATACCGSEANDVQVCGWNTQS